MDIHQFSTPRNARRLATWCSVAGFALASCGSGQLVDAGTAAPAATTAATEAVAPTSEPSVESAPETASTAPAETDVSSDPATEPAATDAESTAPAASEPGDTAETPGSVSAGVTPGAEAYCAAVQDVQELTKRFDDMETSNPSTFEEGFAEFFAQLFSMLPDMADGFQKMADAAPAEIKADLTTMNAVLEPLRSFRGVIDKAVADIKAANGDMTKIQAILQSADIQNKLSALDEMDDPKFDDMNKRVEAWTEANCGGATLDFDGES